MTTTAFPDRVREFFTLQATERDVRALPEAARTSAHRELALAFQKRDAAETLWPRGSCAEALKLARASIDAAASALESFAANVEARHEWVARAQAIAADARQKTSGRPMPELESDARPDDEDTFRTLVEAGLAIERAVGPHLAEPRDLAKLRRSRIVAGAAALVAFALVLAWILHVPTFRQATASAQHGEDGPERAIDGSTKTNWGLPDRQSGSIELTLGRARSIRALHVVPYNPPFDDRVTKDVHVECFLGSTLTKAVDFTFAPPPPGGDAVWSDVPVDAPKSDRIVITVKSWNGVAGSFAEIELK